MAWAQEWPPVKAAEDGRPRFLRAARKAPHSPQRALGAVRRARSASRGRRACRAPPPGARGVSRGVGSQRFPDWSPASALSSLVCSQHGSESNEVNIKMDPSRSSPGTCQARSHRPSKHVGAPGVRPGSSTRAQSPCTSGTACQPPTPACVNYAAVTLGSRPQTWSRRCRQERENMMAWTGRHGRRGSLSGAPAVLPKSHPEIQTRFIPPGSASGRKALSCLQKKSTSFRLTEP